MSHRIIGIAVTLLGIIMLFIGGALFSYRGEPLSNLVSKIGEYSFMLWLPTLIIGIILINTTKKR